MKDISALQSLPGNEAWFWNTDWQVGEREVDRHIAAGDIIVTDGPDEFISSLT
jgi:hypothetical protein